MAVEELASSIPRSVIDEETGDSDRSVGKSLQIQPACFVEARNDQAHCGHFFDCVWFAYFVTGCLAVLRLIAGVECGRGIETVRSLSASQAATSWFPDDE